MNELLMNGAVVNLKNPGTKGLKDFLIVQKAMSKMPRIDTKGKTKEEIEQLMVDDDINFMDYLNDKEFESLTSLINLSLSNTFPDVTPEIDQWAMENGMLIMNDVLEMCSPKQRSNDDDRKQTVIDRLKEQNAKSA